MTTTEFAEEIGVARMTVHRWQEEKFLPARLTENDLLLGQAFVDLMSHTSAPYKLMRALSDQWETGGVEIDTGIIQISLRPSDGT